MCTKHCKIWLIFVIFNCHASDSNKSLKQIHVIFRHGARAPTETYPNDPYINYKWPGGWGHLTTEGKRQMYSLGQNLRAYYSPFLSPYYWPQEVNFTSSYSDRCLMSAELVAAGMYPPKDEQVWNDNLLWQPVPIHYLPRSLDNSIAMKRACKKYDRAFAEVANSRKVADMNSQNRILFEYLSQCTGMPVTDIGIVESLYNTLEIEQQNNLALPSWINSTLMASMKELAARNLALYSETEFMKKMKAGPLLKTIVDLMRKAAVDAKVPLINIYSGHDLTIVQVMRALNLTDTIKPKYGSSLHFEIYSDRSIKVLYKEYWEGLPQEQQLEFCANPCLLDDFESSLSEIIPQDWENECNG
ncbi:lysosomal acid phosphatase-like [Cylas formicarius]|uniref:lysosomal acid phosphatase-like n=1 Tax=Cylas formicarius TaxID=197179 RepID=UPI002958CEB8|nr:lysosomal acid phosphatase-like [Cylas formicarius]